MDAAEAVERLGARGGRPRGVRRHRTAAHISRRGAAPLRILQKETGIHGISNEGQHCTARGHVHSGHLGHLEASALPHMLVCSIFDKPVGISQPIGLAIGDQVIAIFGLARP